MSSDDVFLSDIRRRVEAAERPRATVRELLNAFGYQRRGYYVIREIERGLARYGLTTSPGIEGVYIDGLVEFYDASPEESVETEAEEIDDSHDLLDAVVVVDQHGEIISGAAKDASYRIGKLPAANRAPERLTPNDALKQAVGVMLARDFSQMPVMTTERDVKGVVSWRSISKRAVLTGLAAEVRSVMDAAVEVDSNASLFEAIPLIVRHGYVLVRNAQEKVIQGIVTTSDLALQFRELSEPFLLLGEIENFVRLILDGKFSKKELEGARDPADADREIGSIADLAFGEYIRVLDKEERWVKCGINLDRATFVAQLHRVREIRNDVMHFDPDPIGDANLEFLRDMTRFLQELKSLEVF